jgi:hypothetical protein
MIKIDQCVAILIDGNNIERSLQNVMNKHVLANFDTLIPRLLAERALNRLVYSVNHICDPGGSEG